MTCEKQVVHSTISRSRKAWSGFVKPAFPRNMQPYYNSGSTFLKICQRFSPAKYFVNLGGNISEQAMIQNV